MPYINPSYSIECIGWNQWNIQLLKEAGFVAGTFDARELLDNEQDRVIHACQSRYEKLVPLTGIRKGEDHAEATVANDHVGPTAAEVRREYHTESSQYASAKSEVESGNQSAFSGCLQVQVELLICAIPWKRRLIYAVVGKSSRADCDQHPYALKQMRVRLLNHILMLPWNYFQQEHRNQARQAVYPSQRIQVAKDLESYTPDIDMELVGSHHGGAEMQYRGAGYPDN